MSEAKHYEGVCHTHDEAVHIEGIRDGKPYHSYIAGTNPFQDRATPLDIANAAEIARRWNAYNTLLAENAELLNENIVLKNGYKAATAERDALKAENDRLKKIELEAIQMLSDMENANSPDDWSTSELAAAILPTRKTLSALTPAAKGEE